MSVTQPPSDAPFGLQPNVAAGLAYLLGLVGCIVFLVGGGTNKFVKWAAAQSITLWAVYFILWFVLSFASMMIHMIGLLFFPIAILWFILWIWTFVTGFQGKEIRIPVIADITQSVFKTML